MSSSKDGKCITIYDVDDVDLENPHYYHKEETKNCSATVSANGKKRRCKTPAPWIEREDDDSNSDPVSGKRFCITHAYAEHGQVKKRGAKNQKYGPCSAKTTGNKDCKNGAKYGIPGVEGGFCGCHAKSDDRYELTSAKSSSSSSTSPSSNRSTSTRSSASPTSTGYIAAVNLLLRLFEYLGKGFEALRCLECVMTHKEYGKETDFSEKYGKSFLILLMENGHDEEKLAYIVGLFKKAHEEKPEEYLGWMWENKILPAIEKLKKSTKPKPKMKPIQKSSSSSSSSRKKKVFFHDEMQPIADKDENLFAVLSEETEESEVESEESEDVASETEESEETQKLSPDEEKRIFEAMKTTEVDDEESGVETEDEDLDEKKQISEAEKVVKKIKKEAELQESEDSESSEEASEEIVDKKELLMDESSEESE